MDVKNEFLRSQGDGPSGADGDRLREVFDLAPSFLAVLRGKDHVFDQVNRAYLQLVGDRELVGLPVREALPEVVEQGFIEILDRVFERAEPFVADEVPVKLRRTAGTPAEERIVSFVYHPLRDAAGQVDGIAAHGVDVTDHVRTRDALEKREIYFRSLIENSHDKISVLAPDGTIVYESPAVFRLLGWRDEEVIGRSVLEFIHPDDHATALAQIRLALENPGRPYTLEHRLRHKDGSWLTFESVGQARLTEGGMEIVTNSRDITSRLRGEAELRAAQERFRISQEASPSGFMLFRSVRDEDGSICDFEWEYVNPAGAALVRRDPEDLVGRRLLVELPGNGAAGLFESYVRVVETGEPWSSEFSYAHDGLDSVFRTQAVKVDDGFCAVFSDITAEYAAAEEVREREERFRALVELIPQLVWSTSPDGYHEYFNQRWYDYTGMSRTGEQGWNWKDFLHPDDVERTLAVWQKSLESGEPYQIEYRLRRASDGEHRWFIGRALPLHGPSGEIVRWFGTCTDVHDERMALEAAEESQERLRAVTRATNDVIWDWDLSTDQIWWNENVQRVFRIDPDQFGDALEDWAARIHPEDRERVTSGLHEAIAAGGESWKDEYRLLRGDDSIAYVLDRGWMVRSSSGEPVRMIGSIIDLTERTRLEEELRQAQKMEAIGKLAGGIAHDFNNLLTVVTNYAEILLEDLQSDDPMRSDVDEIRRAAERAASLTRQLLAFGRRQVLQPRTLDLNEIVSEMEKMLRRLIGADIDLISVAGEGLKPVNADPGQLEQVIMNLALNARDAMTSGGTLRVTTEMARLSAARAARSGAAAGEYVLLTVTDTGIGMDEQTRLQVFEPFFTTKPAGYGTGLGLSTVHGIVTQSRGHIEVESEPGRGSTFRVFLPVQAKAPETERSGSAVPQDFSGAGTVLVAEDEEAVRAITRRALTRFGYQVIEASNGHEALTEIECRPGEIDVLLTDLVMPGMGGRELADRVRRLHPTFPIVFMSGYADPDMRPREALDSEAAFLEKPFTIERLVAAVARALAEGVADRGRTDR